MSVRSPRTPIKKRDERAELEQRHQDLIVERQRIREEELQKRRQHEAASADAAAAVAAAAQAAEETRRQDEIKAKDAEIQKLKAEVQSAEAIALEQAHLKTRSEQTAVHLAERVREGEIHMDHQDRRAAHLEAEVQKAEAIALEQAQLKTRSE